MARSIDLRGSPRDRGRAWTRGARIVSPWLAMLVACPSPPPAAPQPDATVEHGRPSTVVDPGSPPTNDPSPPPFVEPSREPSVPVVEPGPPLPAPLARDGVSSVAGVLWRALEEVDAGDATAMSRAMLSSARWFPPGRIDESVGVADLDRAMRPWTNPNLELGLRGVIDLGRRRIVAQLSVHDTSQSVPRWELALVVDAHDDRIANIRQYGDALGPVRPRPEDPGATLELGPLGEISVEGGPPTVANVAATNRLLEALHAKDAAALRSLVTDTVVLHDVTARRTHRGPDAYGTGLRAPLGEHGRLDLLHQHATARVVVLEGTIVDRETDDDGAPLEHGFLDLHRFEDGRIAETWRYVNRRGRPRVATPTATLALP